MRIAFIGLYQVFPPTNGAATVTYNCARHAQGDRVLIQLCAGAPVEEREEDGVRIVSLPGPHGRLRRLAVVPQRLRQIATQCRLLAPDLIVLEGATWVCYLWLLFRLLRREGVTAPVAYHAHNVEQLLRRDQRGRAIGAITAFAESRLARQADYVFAVSEVDREHFCRLYGVRAHLLYNGVDAARFDCVTADEIQAVRTRYGLGEKTVLFMGPYYYSPNREAVDFLVESVFPRVQQQHPGSRLAVLGGDVPYKRPWLITPGSIPAAEVPAFVRACDVGVAPIFSGGGTRLKILEYLMAGTPTVSTRKGAEGLALRDGHDILYAQEPAEFAHQIHRVLADHELAAHLGTSGQQQVRDRYAWPVIMSDFHRIVAPEKPSLCEEGCLP